MQNNSFICNKAYKGGVFYLDNINYLTIEMNNFLANIAANGALMAF